VRGMRRRLTITVAILGLLIAGFVGLVLRLPASKPDVTIGVRAYNHWGSESLDVCLGITNTGHVAIRYNRCNFDSNAWVRTESENGWTNGDIGVIARVPSSQMLLCPGSNTFALLVLPPDTLRWQVGYRTRVASIRERVILRIPSKLRGILDPICKRVLSDKGGSQWEIRSPVFECPQ
jgi:hypothetical protein